MALPIIVSLNDITCEVLFAGYAPASLGPFQVNFTIPANSPISSTVKLTIRVNGVSSQATTLAVQ